jgi:hypothetical protein
MRAFDDPEESSHGGGPGEGFVLMIDPELAPGHRKEGYFGLCELRSMSFFG